MQGTVLSLTVFVALMLSMFEADSLKETGNCSDW